MSIFDSMHIYLKGLLLLTVITFNGSLMATASTTYMTERTAQLKQVGKAKLKVLFWDVYHSTLYSKDGKYLEGEFPQALEISYLRNIDAEDLIDKTEEEWQRLGINQTKAKEWLPLLAGILPDIKKSDSLLLIVNENKQSEFFFNGEPIGGIENEEFGQSFLRIWLDENSSYPKVRNKLVGIKQ